MSNWISYKNGNYTVKLNMKNGTKIRETEEDEFIPSFAENCDCKITDRCDGACGMCYEGCSPSGKHGDILSYKFLDTLHPYTELAINGNDLSHPNLILFLSKLKEKKIITNMTVNQMHFEKYQSLIRDLLKTKLIYGLGVSLREPTDKFIKLIQKYPTAVIHTINGVLTHDQIVELSDKGLKILILGYKTLQRGLDYYKANEETIVKRQQWLKNNLSKVITHFDAVSFDNLALEQLDVKRLLTDEEWEEIFMGKDSEFTFYLDLVEGKFSKNSLSPENERYDILDNIDDMFEKIRFKHETQ